MKKFFIIIGVSIIFSCSLNQYSVKKPIQPGATIGIIAYDYTSGYTSDYPRDISLVVARNFLAKGYNVKALNTINSYLTYPFLRKIFEGELNVKFRTKIEELLKKSVKTSTPFDREVRIKRELEAVKSELGIDYLLVFYRLDKNKYSLIGLDIGNFEVVYVQTYIPPAGCLLVKLLTPFYEERQLDRIVNKFIETINRTGSGAYYGTEK